MFGMLLNIIRNINKSIKKSVQNTKNKVELARAKSAGKEEEQRVKKEQAKRSKPTLGSAIGGIFAKAASAIEAIPVTLVSIKIIAIVLAITIFAIILFSALSALSNMLLQSTIAEASTSLGFTNPYLQSISQESVVDSDGSYHTIIRKITQPDDPDSPDPDDDDPDAPQIYTDDVELWCSLSDAQIYNYLVKEGYTDTSCPGYSMSNFVHLANWLRAVRMAYRICYMRTDVLDGDRIFPGIDPQLLLGMMVFEKGDKWLGLSSSDDDSLGLTYEWYALPGISSRGASLSEQYFYNNSIDVYRSDLFDKNTGDFNYLDGPLSYTYLLNSYDDLGNSMISKAILDNEKYLNAYNNLLMYSEYAPLSTYLSPKSGSTFKDGVPAIKTLFFSMLATAMNFDSGFIAGTAYWKGDLTVDADTGEVSCSGTVNKYYICNTSDAFWSRLDESDLHGATQDSGDIIGVLLCEALGIEDVKDLSYEDRLRYTRQVLNALYYPTYLHIPALNDMYSRMPFGDEEPEFFDWQAYRASMTVLTFSMVAEADGNLSNIGLAELRNKNDSGKLFTAWNSLPTRDIYKNIISGTYTDDVENTEDYGRQFFLDNVGNYANSKAVTLQINTSENVVNIKSSSSTLVDHVLSSGLCIPGSAQLVDFLDNIFFASAYVDGIYNLHNLNVEGYAAYIAGGDICYQLLNNFILVHSGASVEPDEPVSDDIIVPSALSAAFSKASTLSMGGVAYTTNAKGEFTGTTRQMTFPLLDMDNTLDGVNCHVGSSYTMAITQPIGKYMGGSEHGGLDMSNGCSIYGYTSFAVNGATYSLRTSSIGRDFTGSIMGTRYKTANEYCEAMSSVYADSSNDYGARTGVVSIADGVITKICYGLVNSTYAEDSNGNLVTLTADGDSGRLQNLGNSVWVKYKIKLGSTISEIEIAYAHLDPDFLAILLTNLDEQGISYSSIEDLWTDSSWGDTNSNGMFLEYHASGLKIPIKQGTLIGYMGSTGLATGTHLHFQAITNQMWKSGYKAYDYGESLCYILLGVKAYPEKNTNNSSVLVYPFSYEWVMAADEEDTKLTNDMGSFWSSGFNWQISNLPKMISNASKHAST